MRLPFTLSFYIGRQYLISVLLILLALMTVTGLLDTVELIRRSASKEGVTLTIILEMAFFKWPSMAEKLVPFAGLIGGIAALAKLTKSHELIIARAAGVSVWQFMMPPMICMFLFGSVFIAAFNPIAASTLARFEKLENKYISGRSSMLAISASGLWLRQAERNQETPEHEYIIHALNVTEQGVRLSYVTIFSFDANAKFLYRIDAESATLQKGFWQINNAKISSPGHPAKHEAVRTLNTDLTLSQIQDSFASPRTLSFWELPGFIHSLEMAGFDALNHRLYWHRVLSLPLLLCAMTLLAAIFSLRMPRKGGSRTLVVAGIFTGFLLFFISDIIFALGLSGSLPVVLAAWAPSILVLLLGAAMLLHLEDG